MSAASMQVLMASMGDGSTDLSFAPDVPRQVAIGALRRFREAVEGPWGVDLLRIPGDPLMPGRLLQKLARISKEEYEAYMAETQANPDRRDNAEATA